MDPLTLFALCNGAVAAVKKGCQLYKDIKSAAGDVKGVLKDLDNQFHSKYEGKPVPPEAVKQLNEEKTRVKELNKRSEETSNLYIEIGDYLGEYYDNYFKCVAVLEDEEKRSSTEVYAGGDSLAKRALKRVLMHKQLEQMGKELRELMIYQSPPELGALYTEVESMTKVLGAQQKILITKQIEKDRQRRQKRSIYYFEIAIIIAGITLFFFTMMMFMVIAHDAKQRWSSLDDKPYQKRLESVRRQEWYDHKRKLQEYEDYLYLKNSQKENETNN